jgi:hypothetical protein
VTNSEINWTKLSFEIEIPSPALFLTSYFKFVKNWLIPCANIIYLWMESKFYLIHG